MTDSKDLSAVIDARGLTPIQLRAIILCLLAMLIDGFDMLVVPFVGPAMFKDLHMAPSLLGTLISAGLFGMVISGLAGGMAADKIGRRPVILTGLLIFGTASILRGFVKSYEELLLLQFIIGLGLGGTFMNVMALAGEYAPTKSRRFIVSCVSTAYPLGGIVAGYVTTLMLPRFGWQSVYFAGGGAALFLLVVSFFALPPSVRQLVLMGRSPEKVRAVMAKIAPEVPGETIWMVDEPSMAKLPVAEIMRDGRAGLTWLLAFTVMSTLMAAYFVSSWSPTLLTTGGVPMKEAVIVTVALHGGAVLGSLLWAALADRIWPPAVLGFAAGITTICFAIMGHVAWSYPLLLGTFFVGGLGMGVQNAYNGLIASVYPTAMRGTALGFIIGVGRVGSIAGPLIGGALISAHWDVTRLYYITGAIASVACICMILASILARPRAIIASSRLSPSLSPAE